MTIHPVFNFFHSQYAPFFSSFSFSKFNTVGWVLQRLVGTILRDLYLDKCLFGLSDIFFISLVKGLNITNFQFYFEEFTVIYCFYLGAHLAILSATGATSICLWESCHVVPATWNHWNHILDFIFIVKHRLVN